MSGFASGAHVVVDAKATLFGRGGWGGFCFCLQTGEDFPHHFGDECFVNRCHFLFGLLGFIENVFCDIHGVDDPDDYGVDWGCFVVGGESGGASLNNQDDLAFARSEAIDNDERTRARFPRQRRWRVDHQRPDEEQLVSSQLGIFFGGNDAAFDAGEDHGKELGGLLGFWQDSDEVGMWASDYANGDDFSEGLGGNFACFSGGLDGGDIASHADRDHGISDLSDGADEFDIC